MSQQAQNITRKIRKSTYKHENSGSHATKQCSCSWSFGSLVLGLGYGSRRDTDNKSNKRKQSKMGLIIKSCATTAIGHFLI
jgi:hypothetical protein